MGKDRKKESFHHSRTARPLAKCVLVFLFFPSAQSFLLPGALRLPPGITVLLSLTVFMLMVAEIMPATSDSVPLIGVFFLALSCAEKNFCICWKEKQYMPFSMVPVPLRSVLCQHHGDCGDVRCCHSHRPSVSPSQPQQRTYAAIGKSQTSVSVSHF